MIEWQNVDPTKLDPNLLEKLQLLASRLNAPIQVLSGFRTTSEFADSLHLTGRAVDFYTSAAPSKVHEAALDLFDGIGVYINENNIVSWHVDNRGKAARWGAVVSPKEGGGRQYRYTTFAEVWSLVSKASTYVLPLFILAVLLLVLGRVK